MRTCTCIMQGLAFVDKSFDVLKQKDIREGFCNIYAQYWLKFLLHLVDVTKPGADEHLVMYFSRAKSQVLKKYYAQLCDDVCAKTNVYSRTLLMFANAVNQKNKRVI